MIGSIRRIWALMCKEFLLQRRDPTIVLTGIVLPIIFLLLFGYALSLDVKNIKLCIVTPEYNDSFTNEIIARFKDNGYFKVEVTDSVKVAAERLSSRKADVTLSVSPRLNRTAGFGKGQFLISVNGTQAPIARGYEGTVAGLVEAVVASAGGNPFGIAVNAQMWFNASNNSRWFIMPGAIMVIMSAIGCLLTAMQVAKEYETGTIESLFSTPVSPTEILLSKLFSIYIVGMIGLTLCLGFSAFLFRVPLRGSLAWVFFVSSLFLIAQMSFGLAISALTKNQQVAMNIAAAVSFMPAMSLSGFVFEISNMPVPVQWITWALPARYYTEFLKTAFLVGDDVRIYLADAIPLALFMLVALWLSQRSVRRQEKESAK